MKFIGWTAFFGLMGAGMMGASLGGIEPLVRYFGF